MTCKELVDFLADYRSGELEPEIHSCFEAHLRECPACVSYLSSYEETIRLGREAFSSLEGTVPEDVPEELVASILSARAAARRDGRE